MNQIKFLSGMFIATMLSATSFSQHLSAYVDYMGRFYAFDSGNSIKIEDFEPQSFKIGGECILYINNAGHLKLYQDGNVELLERGGATENDYFVTDKLAGYNIFERLKVIFKGKVMELSNYCLGYLAEDNLIAFYDKNQESLRVFYNGTVQNIESGMMGVPFQFWACGDNTVAYISNRTKDFKIWYQSETYTVERNVERTLFKAGKDVVAYVDDLEQSFKAFYKGEEYLLSDFPPESYEVANGRVVFVDNMGEFKCFENSEVITISTIRPEAYIAKDYNLAYIEDGRFKVWYNNESIEVEAWVPSVFKIDWNTIAYVDNSRRLWKFQNGEKKYISNEFIESFEIYRDLIQMNIKSNKTLIYYKDKFYKGEY